MSVIAASYDRMSMRNSHRGINCWPPPINGAVRGGGGLWRLSPLEGYKEEEMVAEAQLRQAHNKKRSQFKQRLTVASGGGATVGARDLVQAAELSHISLPRNMLEAKAFVMERTGSGKPRKYSWRPLYASVDYPALRGPGGFAESELPSFRKTAMSAKTSTDARPEGEQTQLSVPAADQSMMEQSTSE